MIRSRVLGPVGKRAIYPLSCHGLKFLVQMMEGSDTQLDISGGDAAKNLEKKNTEKR